MRAAERATCARDAAIAAGAFVVLTLVFTWPTVLHPATKVPADLSDPLLNCWILAWDAEHLLRALSGHLSALSKYWNANIFYPQPLALAYSEHLTVEAISILPIYAFTRNPILCYNAVFWSTFALSGLGAYLFARELTGSRAAAFVAGVAYAFAPYRFSTLPHVQVLSSQWMPFALYGLRRYFVTRRPTPLAWAAVAFVAQGLSCGYYLVFFAPVVALYAAWEIAVRRLWSDTRLWRDLGAVALLSAVAIAPFLIPYLRLRRLGFDARSLTETDRYSANAYAYFTADLILRFWGRVARAWPAPEGSLFPGATIAGLSVACVVFTWRRVRATKAESSLANVLGWMLVAAGAVLVAMLAWGPIRFTFGVLPIKTTDLNRVLLVIAILTVALLTISSPARVTARRWFASPPAILAVVAIFSIAMSFGPRLYVGTKLMEDPALYRMFFDYVPGFDALRVPARFGMIVALALAPLAALALMFVPPGRRTLAASAATFLILIESYAVPLPVNFNDTSYRQTGLAPLPAAVMPPPAVYDIVATQLPPDAVILELPIGEVPFEARYMFYSTRHWRRLINGYSGGMPQSYALLSSNLSDALLAPDRAWASLAASGASHVIVHEAYYSGSRGDAMTRWLESHGLRTIARAGTDLVLEMPR